MKKIFIIIMILLLFLPINTYALEKKNVKYKGCIDGDTIYVIMNKRKIKVRLLAVDTPETNHPNKGEESYGKEAKDFTCKKLSDAKKVQIEFDSNSTKKDKYDRYLVWVFYDNNLLQLELVKNGLAEVTYLFDDYKYTSLLIDAQEKAKINKKGIYSNVDTSYYKTTKSLKERIKKRVDKFLKKLKANVNDLFDEILKEIL